MKTTAVYIRIKVDITTGDVYTSGWQTFETTTGTGNISRVFEIQLK